MEEWKPIFAFPNYVVSSLGRVMNQDTGKLMTQNKTQFGLPYVGLTKSKVQFRRLVVVLVANAFVPLPTHRNLEVLQTFDTPINLDGDRTNNRSDNLAWRPRWFAIMYHKQFHNNERGFNVPIYEVNTGEEFNTSWEAAIKYGLIDKEILLASINRTYVWPTFQQFNTIDADIIS